VEALSEALSEWGDEKGAIVVVSHDRNFCDKIVFTHVATVKDGTFQLEERGARNSDWVIEGLSSSSSSDDEASVDASNKKPKAPSSKELDPKLRKQAYNAPKRIKKLEGLIEKAEAKIVELEELMLANDVGKLVDWTKEKASLRSQVEVYMAEWNDLEEILAQVAAATAT
jgi:ABC transporter C-terminal domain